MVSRSAAWILGWAGPQTPPHAYLSNDTFRIKDGGVFVNFQYTPMSVSESVGTPRSSLDTPDPALAEIEQTLLDNIAANGGLPSWLGLKHGKLWRVRGKPWKEDMRRYASPILRVAFEGPDVGDEHLWDILRVYTLFYFISSMIFNSKYTTHSPTGASVI